MATQATEKHTIGAVLRFTPRAVTLPTNAPPPGPRYVLETGNTFLNRWVLR